MIETFGRFEAAYRAGDYKETEVRREFVDPFFTALGWDVANTAGKDPISKDVVHEQSVSTTGNIRLPDYSFQIGGKARFFVEAKRPSVNLKEGVKPAIQIRSYCWSAKLTVGVLTDFEELAVYDCRYEPRPADSAGTARLKYFRWTEYADRWDELDELLSRDAVASGSLENFVPGAAADRRSVDNAFLDEIEGWRGNLARDLAKRNPALNWRDLNFAVQQTIDRIVFLRIAEDRGLEPPDQLKGLLSTKKAGGQLYAELVKLFYRADEKYNSGLFHFDSEQGRSESPDVLTPNLKVGSRVIEHILRRLYFPESVYQFSVFPADILGQVYERFLGKVITLSHKRRVSIVEKPEVRKAGGIYYTPGYIVDYIVRSSLLTWLEKPAPTRAGRRTSELRILDLACGSGSFLLEAYDRLLQWYETTYLVEPARWLKSRPPRLWEAPGGELRLTGGERQRILKKHIFGVDIDPQAVEVTKLSLLLKVLEGESDRTVNQNLTLFHERALPDLGANIKCGNSIIGSDFYQAHIGAVDPDERYRINPFDWDIEFAEVVAAGGFDVIVGNPPYRKERSYKVLLDDVASTPFGKRFRSPRMDLWYYFVHRGLSLLRKGGKLGFIVNSYWTSGTGAAKLIGALKEEAHVEEIFALGKLPVFAGVSGRHLMFRLEKKIGDRPTTVKIVRPAGGEQSAAPFVVGSAEVAKFAKDKDQLFRGDRVDLLPDESGVLAKFASCDRLDSLGSVRQGIVENPADINRRTNEAFDDRWRVGEGVFSLTPKELRAVGITKAERKRVVRPYHDLVDLGRYWSANDPSRRLIYSTGDTWPELGDNPVLAAHLKKFKPIMDRRRETENGVREWWQLHWPREEPIFTAPKIVALQMAARPSFVVTSSPTYVPFSVNVFVPSETVKESLDFFAAILNSNLGWLWFTHHAKQRGVGLDIGGTVLREFPVRRIDFSDPADQQLHDGLTESARNLAITEAESRQAGGGHRAALVDRERTRLEEATDKLVYELYGLDDEGIKAVELSLSTDP